MLVGTNHGGINHRIFGIGIFGESFKNPLPNAPLAPAGVARMDHPEVSESLRQITPCDPGAVPISHRFNKQPVIFGRPTDMARTARQNILDPIPWS